MKTSQKCEGFSLVSSDPRINNIEAHCRKVHGEAVIESIRIAFSAPIDVADKLFSTKEKPSDRDKAAAL